MTVSEQIIQVIDELCKRFGIVVDWTSENIIPCISILFEKLIKYEIITSGLGIVASIFFFAISIWFVKKTWSAYQKEKEKHKDKYWDDIGWVVFLAITYTIIGIVNAATIVSSIVNVETIIKCIVVPELYIFEYISSLIETM